ncbi:DUF4595 domain-containing protein [Flammeovirga kamogawensis]|uniref:DUF4595 domain-containing protein n=1 Tax=Flammeovirga kamogawensis TaxID=373891 RepID=A0ABX8GUH5_9BACT|nr:DUF4595 domain-containing protein [Flammeovirga kamogawensis]MBB6459725.1 YD repeat-containing protein [Flammeovirga kamogawensis]QWG07216.1 DUF4595 domain-containing protein [Flammeovirga kamogawensis]TRX69036.1 DUF4595 domain-containing protein [Flammeovirga kamogawensis]
MKKSTIFIGLLSLSVAFSCSKNKDEITPKAPDTVTKKKEQVVQTKKIEEENKFITSYNQIMYGSEFRNKFKIQHKHTIQQGKVISTLNTNLLFLNYGDITTTLTHKYTGDQITSSKNTEGTTFEYTYNKEGYIATMKEKKAAGGAKDFSYTYSAEGKLLTVEVVDHKNGTTSKYTLTYNGDNFEVIQGKHVTKITVKDNKVTHVDDVLNNTHTVYEIEYDNEGRISSYKNKGNGISPFRVYHDMKETYTYTNSTFIKSNYTKDVLEYQTEINKTTLKRISKKVFDYNQSGYSYLVTYKNDLSQKIEIFKGKKIVKSNLLGYTTVDTRGQYNFAELKSFYDVNDKKLFQKDNYTFYTADKSKSLSESEVSKTSAWVVTLEKEFSNL